ncbi:hypothetical protein T08_1712 [Trichinella sp. T8]|nr:hypothetical protein T08_1712 [Trichinella sp. T8]
MAEGWNGHHPRGRPYLTLIECGPSRFAVWRRLRVHCSANVTEAGGGVLQTGDPGRVANGQRHRFPRKDLYGVRRPVGSPSAVPMCLRAIRQWHSGEMSSKREGHRCEKELHGGRGGVLVQRYTRETAATRGTAPANVVNAYAVRVRGVDQATEEPEEMNGRFAVGDSVWVKP